MVIGENENFIVDGKVTGINVPMFLYDLQQPFKEISNPDYFKFLEALKIKEDLLINSNAKIAIRKITQRVTKQNEKIKLLRHKESSTKKPVNHLQRSPQTPEVVLKPQRKKEFSKRRKTASLSTDEKKLLELKYRKAPAAYGSLKSLQKTQI